MPLTDVGKYDKYGGPGSPNREEAILRDVQQSIGNDGSNDDLLNSGEFETKVRGIVAQFLIENGYTMTLMVFDGNSLFANNSTPQDMTGVDIPAKIATAYGIANHTYYNFASNGQSTSQMSTDAATQIDTLYSTTTYGKNICFAWEITNELASGVSATTAFNNYKTYCLARKAAGFKVMALTVLPRTSLFSNGVTSSTFETARIAVNAMLLNQFTDFADAIVDAGSIPGLTYSDGTHPDEAGRVLIAAALKTGTDYLIAGNSTYQAYPPLLIADDTANTLEAFHVLGTSEVLVSENNGSYAAISTATGWNSSTNKIDVGDVVRSIDYWKFKIKAATNRLASSVVGSPAFTIASNVPVLRVYEDFTNAGQLQGRAISPTGLGNWGNFSTGSVGWICDSGVLKNITGGFVNAYGALNTGEFNQDIYVTIARAGNAGEETYIYANVASDNSFAIIAEVMTGNIYIREGGAWLNTAFDGTGISVANDVIRFVVDRTNDTAKVYRNGTLINTASITGKATSNLFAIGQTNQNIWLDEFKVYSF